MTGSIERPSQLAARYFTVTEKNEVEIVQVLPYESLR